MDARLETLYRMQPLSAAETDALFTEVFAGSMSEPELASLLTALKMKGETPDEIRGAAAAMLRAARPFPKSAFEVGEIVGTGGDGAGTINVSTMTALAAAGTGLRIAKHGNRGVSSPSGASDLLAALGVDIADAPEDGLRMLERTGFAFCFAQSYHPAMRFAAPVRKALGTRTIFNVLGPLTNPAHPDYALIGVYDPSLLMTMAKTLRELGVKRAMVVHGSGLDEAAIHGPTDYVAYDETSEPRTGRFTPEDFGLSEPFPLEAVRGGSPEENARIAEAVLSGCGTPAQKAVVTANLALLLMLGRRAGTLPEALEPETDTFAAIRKRDLMFYHPYETFGGVLNFLQKAATDPNVVAIKQTLYRCGSDSPVVRSLLEARRLGKQVTAVVELKARFDEEQNINWAEELEAAGVNVVYGFAGLKIHAKLCLVVRREPEGLRRYVHVGTGNYNAGSAKIYTDLGILTADDAICDDVQDLFNVMTGCGIIDEYRKLFVSPKGTRPNIVRLIEEEVALHKKHGGGHIILKCNQLVDPGIVRELYKASQAGVRIECIVRGICSIRPGIPGVSETITVRSIVGRLLEHARIYYFRHAGNEKMYVGSADLMPRNLNGRIEVLAPVTDPDIRANVLDQIVRPQLADNIHAWELQADGSYVKQHPAEGEAVYDSQEEIGRVLNLMKRRK